MSKFLEAVENNIPDSNITSELDQNEKSHETELASEEYTPQLFSDENSIVTEDTEDTEDNVGLADDRNNKLFDQDISEEEDFEIPAFLRKQKF